MKNFSRKDVMTYAWKLKREKGLNMSVALKTAWAFFKQADKAEEDGKACGWNYKVIINDWVKYGYDRTYINLRIYTNAWNCKREEKYGYIDNLTGNVVA